MTDLTPLLYAGGIPTVVGAAFYIEHRIRSAFRSNTEVTKTTEASVWTPATTLQTPEQRAGAPLCQSCHVSPGEGLIWFEGRDYFVCDTCAVAGVGTPVMDPSVREILVKRYPSQAVTQR